MDDVNNRYISQNCYLDHTDYISCIDDTTGFLLHHDSLTLGVGSLDIGFMPGSYWKNNNDDFGPDDYTIRYNFRYCSQ